MAKRHQVVRNFAADGALKTALGFHSVAYHLFQGAFSSPHASAETVGQVAAVGVLEALALELILKVRASRAGESVLKTHDHSDLFACLPDADREEAAQRYALSGPPLGLVAVVGLGAQAVGAAPYQLMSPPTTLSELLRVSGRLFEDWRYIHEARVAEAPIAQMFFAFDALNYGF